MSTITKSKSVSFSFLSRPTYPVLLLIFYLQQEIKLEWPYNSYRSSKVSSYCFLISYWVERREYLLKRDGYQNRWLLLRLLKMDAEHDLLALESSCQKQSNLIVNVDGPYSYRTV